MAGQRVQACKKTSILFILLVLATTGESKTVLSAKLQRLAHSPNNFFNRFNQADLIPADIPAEWIPADTGNNDGKTNDGIAKEKNAEQNKADMITDNKSFVENVFSRQRKADWEAEEDCAIHQVEHVHVVMDRLCLICHEAFSHVHRTLRSDCRRNCFDNDDFRKCLRIYEAQPSSDDQ